MKLLLLLLQLTLFGVSLGKLGGYEYQQPDDIAIHQSIAYMPLQQNAYITPQYQQQSYAPIQETYKKEFFIYSAPEEEFEDLNAAHKVASTIQKNVRVLFIRAPEQKGLEHAALQLAKQVSDDKTAIYVLSKQTDIGDLANRLSVHREQYTHKPEVHFVKYRTPEDAAQAQQQIQAQYDLLRGTSHTSNEGAAPVLDFSTRQQPIYGSAISVAPSYATGGSSSYGNGGAANILGNNLRGYYAQPVTSNAGLAAIGGTHNSFSSSSSSYKTVGYNTNSITTTNGDSYGGVSTAGGFDNIGYNANAIQNGAVSTSINSYGDPRAGSAQQILAENAVSRLNERVNLGGKLTFPNEVVNENTYLPPLKSRL